MSGTLSPPDGVASDVSRALREDIGSGDCTAALIPADTLLDTRVISRESAVLCGSPWFSETFHQLDPAVRLEWQASRRQAHSFISALECVGYPALDSFLAV